MRTAFGVFLLLVALAGAFGLGVLSYEIDPPKTVVELFVLLSLLFGVFGPVVNLGLYLAAGGWNMSRKAHLIYLGTLALCCLASILGDLAAGPPSFQQVEFFGFIMTITVGPILIGLIPAKKDD